MASTKRISKVSKVSGVGLALSDFARGRLNSRSTPNKWQACVEVLDLVGTMTSNELKESTKRTVKT
jgi:hypothetical protein